MKILIRKNETGEVREHEWERPNGFEDYDIHELWAEGNYGCDCNRGIFFDAAKQQGADWDAYKCSKGKYSVQIDGILDEFPDEHAQ